MKVRQLLRAAMRVIGVAEGADAQAYADALESCNSMLKLWAARGRVTHHIITEPFPLVVGQESYTIGIGGNFDTSRPSEVAGGFTRDTNNVDLQIHPVDREQYNLNPNKTVRGRPRHIYYNPTYPLAVVHLQPVPDLAYTLSLDSVKPLTTLVSLDSDINLPPEYEEAIKYNLAVRLAPENGVPLTAEVVGLALNAYNSLPRQPVPAAQFDCIGTRYNINVE